MGRILVQCGVSGNCDWWLRLALFMVGVANAIVGSFVNCGIALRGRSAGLTGGAEMREG